MTKFNNGESIRDEGHRIVNEMRDTRVQRERADAKREGFFELHQRQKETFATQADRLDNFESNAPTTINSLVRLRTYVMLTDPHLGPFINEARMKARTAYLTGTRNWHHHYVHDVADVDIKLTGRSVYIRIMPNDRFFFEFATTGNPVVTTTVDQDGITYDSYKGCMVGVNVQVEKGRMVTRPRILQNKRSEYGEDLSLVERPYQVQLINEPVVYPNSEFKFGRVRSKRTLFESFVPGHPWSGLTLRSTDGPFLTFGITTVCGPGSTFAMRDHGFDVPWQDGEKAEPIRNAYVRDTADWPAANAIQKVEDPVHGTREFGIYVDQFNQFAVFPLAAIGPLNPTNPVLQNIPEVYIQRLTPTLGAWVYVPTTKASDYWPSNPDVQEWSVDQPITDWKFNHLGTKCAAIVFEREPYDFDTSFWSTDSNASCPFNSTKFDTLASWLGSDTNYSQAFSPNTYAQQRYFIAPGIVEITVNIQLTGPDLNQFVATLEVEEIRRPSTMDDDPTKNRYALFVGYVWHKTPKKTNTNVTVEAGTLVALDIEYWIRPDGTFGEDTDRQLLLSVRDVATNVEVLSTVAAPILAVDLTTLSMVLRLDGYSTERKSAAKYSGGSATLNFPVHHFGAWIIHSGVSKEVLFPDSTPEDMKLLINTYAVMNGREFFAQRIAETGSGWEYVPVTTAKDGWTDASLNSYRNWWAYQFWYADDYWYAFIDTDLGFYGDRVKYKTSGSPPAFPGDGEDSEKWLASIGGDFRTLFFCDNPRWGWNAYVQFVPNFMAVSAYATFFAHPNGSYAFWSDAWLYDRNGLPGDYVSALGAGAFGVSLGSGIDYQYDTLALYDASLVEHVIFDRVHFEIRVRDRPSFTNNTTFLELYNRAVELGVTNETLPAEENILTMEKSDMQATFTKETGDDTGIEHYFLDFKMTWDGENWWYRESAYSDTYAGTPFPPFVGSAGNFNNINTYNYWRTTNYAGAGYAQSAGSAREGESSNWHRRFANPLIIMEK